MCMADARGGGCPFLPSGKTRRGVRRELEESWKRGRRKLPSRQKHFGICTGVTKHRKRHREAGPLQAARPSTLSVCAAPASTTPRPLTNTLNGRPALPPPLPCLAAWHARQKATRVTGCNPTAACRATRSHHPDDHRTGQLSFYHVVRAVTHARRMADEVRLADVQDRICNGINQGWNSDV
jgi:hypothetical protein